MLRSPLRAMGRGVEAAAGHGGPGAAGSDPESRSVLFAHGPSCVHVRRAKCGCGCAVESELSDCCGVISALLMNGDIR